MCVTCNIGDSLWRNCAFHWVRVEGLGLRVHVGHLGDGCRLLFKALCESGRFIMG